MTDTRCWAGVDCLISITLTTNAVNKKLIEKFIRGKCSPEEELKVIEWLREEDYEAALEKMIIEDLQEAYESGSPEHKDLSHIRNEILKRYSISTRRKDQAAFPPQPLLRIAASIAILIAVGLGVFHFANESSKVDLNEEVTSQVVKSNPRGRKTTISLGDGTTIYLNSESKIIYPNKFPDSVRVIQLEGEAFFEVTKDERRPTRLSLVKVSSSKERMILPNNTIGRLIRKLRVRAVDLLKFLINKKETVNPERENPGRAANP